MNRWRSVFLEGFMYSLPSLVQKGFNFLEAECLCIAHVVSFIFASRSLSQTSEMAQPHKEKKNRKRKGEREIKVCICTLTCHFTSTLHIYNVSETTRGKDFTGWGLENFEVGNIINVNIRIFMCRRQSAQILDVCVEDERGLLLRASGISPSHKWSFKHHLTKVEQEMVR